MLNYTKTATDLTSPLAVEDTLSDIASDLHGMELTMLALADAPIIEPEQMHPLAAIAGHMSEALADVVQYLADARHDAEGVA